MTVVLWLRHGRVAHDKVGHRLELMRCHLRNALLVANLRQYPTLQARKRFNHTPDQSQISENIGRLQEKLDLAPLRGLFRTEGVALRVLVVIFTPQQPEKRSR